MTPYDQFSIQDLVKLAIERDILLSPDNLNDKESIIKELQKLEKSKLGRVEILNSYDKDPEKWQVSHFVRYFRKRYSQLSAILRSRKELQSVTSIGRVIGKKERERVSLIGLVMDKKETKNKHVVLKLEDPTGIIEVWLSAKNKELQEVGKEIVLDECIGITGQTSNGRVFADKIFFPDVPLHKELKKGEKEEYVVFIGDIEVGAKLFMKEEFEHLIMWLSGKIGTEEQKRIAKKIKYAVLIGDLVHGAGVYPNQHIDQHEEFYDVVKQYEELTKYLKMIPSHIQIILTTGNHDPSRLQEPQMPIYKDMCEEIYAMPNVTIVSNPAMINIAQTQNHPGFDILLYHGYSIPYYADNIQPIREKGGMAVCEEIMKIYLKKRHLAPSHGCNQYVPDPEGDPMVIDKVPDFLITGHVHRIAHGTYNGVTMIQCGCWNDLSQEQIRRGLDADPAKLPIVNLKTRELKIMNFYPQEEKNE